MPGTLRLHREKRPWRDRAQAWKVMIDGVQIADIRNGQSISVPLTSGEHILRLQMDWTGSPEATFRVRDRGSADFVAYPSGSAVVVIWKLIQSLWDRTSWITLRAAKPYTDADR